MIQEVFADNKPMGQEADAPGFCYCWCWTVPWFEMDWNMWINFPY